MVTAEKSIAIKAPVKKIHQVITDFTSYPTFLEEIERAEVIKKSASSATAAFTMNMMQRIDYTLKFDLKKKDEIPWSLVEGDSLLKDNSGFWKIEEMEPGICDLTYHVNVDFNVWLPGSVVESLLNDHLPKMLEKFKERAEAKS